MKKPAKSFSIILSVVFLFACMPQTSNKVTVSVKNITNKDFTDVLVKVKTDSLKNVLDLSDAEKIVVKSGETAIPFQTIDKDRDGTADKILFMADVAANSANEYSINVVNGKQESNFVKRTQAEIAIKEGGDWTTVIDENGEEKTKYKGGKYKNITSLKVPEQNTDNAFFFKYEGPGWESDKVAYRFYLDWRLATDIFGKTVDTMALQKVGVEGDSYHEMLPWGMDILKVGNSLGMAAPGYWNGKSAQRIDKKDSTYFEILENGILYSKIKTMFYGWEAGNNKVDVDYILSIHAGTRLTKAVLTMDKTLDNLCTGIVKHENTELILPETSKGDWAYLATYGPQSYINDNLGMAIFYKTSDLIEITEDEYSDIIVLKPTNNMVKYYFGAAWEKEKNGIKNIDEFKVYLNATIENLNNPVEVSIK